MHLNSENILVEFVEDGKPAEAGQLASSVVTDLTNYRMPLVRYCNMDMGSYSTDSCLCGRGLPLMEISIGREVDLIRLKGGRILHPEILTLPHSSALFKDVRQYKIHQRSLRHFFIQVEVEPGSKSQVVDAFSRFVRDQLGEDITLEFETVDHIPREKSGKLRYFVSEVEAA